MKKIIQILVLFGAFFSNDMLFARDVLIITQNPADADVNAALIDAVNQVNNGAVGQLGDFSDLSKGFADAGTMAASAGNLNSYQGYDRYAIFTGATFAMQVPNLWDELMDIAFEGEHKSLKQDIIENGDPYFGLAAGLAWVNVGINVNEYVENLYVNVKFGSGGLNYRSFEYDSTLFGIGANYNWIKSESLWGNFLKWRGVSIGSGLLYYNSSISYTLDGYNSVTANSGAATVVLDPGLKMDMDVTTYTIPVNVVTSVQAFWLLNLSAGGGFDINFGNSEIDLSSTSNITVSGVSSDTGQVAAVHDSKGFSPSIIRLKYFYGLGLNLGPAKLELQNHFYIGGGFAWTINAGAVF